MARATSPIWHGVLPQGPHALGIAGGHILASDTSSRDASSPVNMESVKLPSDRLLQVVVLGESGVGKTSLVDKVIHDAQYVRYEPASFFPTDGTRSDTQLSLTFEGHNYDLELKDVNLTPIRLRDPGIMVGLFIEWLKYADGIVLMYDITDANSYGHVTGWAWNYIQACRMSDLGRGWDDPTIRR